MPAVVTGFLDQEGPAVRRLAESRHRVLFGPESPADQLYSDYVFVTLGQRIMLQAFHLPAGKAVFTNMVSTGTGRSGGLPMDLYIQRMTLGGADKWIMREDNPQMIISLPGVYRFELEDESILGQDFRLDYCSWMSDPPVPDFPVMR
jgi:hypothetical protein